MLSRNPQIVCAFLLAAFVSVAAGQNQPAKQSDSSSTEEKSHWSLFPNAASVSRQDATPLTAGQKFKLFGEQTVNPFYFVATAAQAGVSQAANSYPSYGQGAEGYGKRYGAAFAGSTTNNFFSTFLFPVLLKEDPRYFRLGTGSTGHRFGYAITQEFVGYSDDGRRTVVYSNVLGAVVSGGISNAYYPEADRGAALTMRNAGYSLAFGVANGVLSEFWPDVKHKLFGKKK